MTKYALVLAAVCVASFANAQVLFNNAAGRGAAEPIGLGTDVRGAGGWYSRLQTTQSTFGAGAQGGTVHNRVADDFSVGTAWNITTANFYMYQTGATTATINGGTFQIMGNAAGAPDGVVVANGTFGSASLTNIFRTVSGGTDETRRIQELTVNFNTTLGPGSYWMVWEATGTGASGPWQPAITISGLSQPPGSANAMQSLNGAAFAPIIDATVGQDLPFIINGAPVPEPASMVALGLGAAALLRRRRAAKK